MNILLIINHISHSIPYTSLYISIHLYTTLSKLHHCLPLFVYYWMGFCVTWSQLSHQAEVNLLGLGWHLRRETARGSTDDWQSRWFNLGLLLWFEILKDMFMDVYIYIYSCGKCGGFRFSHLHLKSCHFPMYISVLGGSPQELHGSNSWREAPSLLVPNFYPISLW